LLLHDASNQTLTMTARRARSSIDLMRLSVSSCRTIGTNEIANGAAASVDC
jgi:hypothetical protein